MSRRNGAAVARWVAEQVHEVAPPGLGKWPPAWDIVELPSLDYLEALGRWVVTGSVADRQAARIAASAVITAWGEAARRWETGGRHEGLWKRAEPGPDAVQVDRWFVVPARPLIKHGARQEHERALAKSRGARRGGRGRSCARWHK